MVYQSNQSFLKQVKNIDKIPKKINDKYIIPAQDRKMLGGNKKEVISMPVKKKTAHKKTTTKKATSKKTKTKAKKRK